MSEYELAQLNIAQLVAPLESPILAGFVNNLDRINALAEESTGFVWRLQTEEGDATGFRPFPEDDILVNLSVWKDIESLHQFVYKSAHVEIMRQRKQWFKKMEQVYTVLWWIPRGDIPSIEEAKTKLVHLQTHGPTAEAFSFKQPYPPPSQTDSEELQEFDDTCPAT